MIGQAHLYNLRTGEIIENLAEHSSYIYDNYKKFGLKEEDLNLYNPEDTEPFVLLAMRRGWARIRVGGGILSIEHFRASDRQISNAVAEMIMKFGLNTNSLSIQVEDFNNRARSYTMDFEEFNHLYADGRSPFISQSILHLYEDMD